MPACRRIIFAGPMCHHDDIRIAANVEGSFAVAETKQACRIAGKQLSSQRQRQVAFEKTFQEQRKALPVRARPRHSSACPDRSCDRATSSHDRSKQR
jgi:hypothetical protein